MEVNRLNQEELSYEILARGLKTGSVDEMRKVLRGAIKNEKIGPGFASAVYPFTYKDDVEAVEGKIAEIKMLLENFEGNSTSREYRKIQTKIMWALSRLGRCTAESDEEIEKKKSLNNDIVSALGSLDIKAVGNESADDSSSSGSEPASTNSKVPIYKWGIQFSGEKGQSLNSFLERVTELSEARGVSQQKLFRSALDLFSDRALIWYRAYKHQFKSWSELVKELRLEFLPPDYDDRLMEEIKRRTQGQNESMGTYVAIMSSLYSRLSQPLSEAEQLRILKRNMNPFYQSQLGLSEVLTIKDLIDKGRKLESIRASVEAFVPPPSRRHGNLLEPDLAYVMQDGPSTSSAQDTNRRPKYQCSLCKKDGHTIKFCRQRRRCYGCGAIGVIRATCMNCSNRPGTPGNNRESGRGPMNARNSHISQENNPRASTSQNVGSSESARNRSTGNGSRAQP